MHMTYDLSFLLVLPISMFSLSNCLRYSIEVCLLLQLQQTLRAFMNNPDVDIIITNIR